MTAQGLPPAWAHELIRRLDTRVQGGNSRLPYSPPLAYPDRV